MLFRSGSIDLPSNFKREIPTCRGIYTAGTLDTYGTPTSLYGGHLLEFDDGEAKWNNENANPPTITHGTTNKGVRLTTSGGNFIKIYEEGSQGSSRNLIHIEFNSKNGSKYIKLDGETNQIEISDGTKSIEIDTAAGSIIKLGSDAADTENLILGQVFKTFASSLLDYLIAHTHATAVGPSGPPNNAADFAVLKVSPITDESILSDVAFTEKS